MKIIPMIFVQGVEMEVCKKTVLPILGILLLFSHVVGAEMSPARMRASEQRAQDITKARNEYVKQVLQAYRIPFKTNDRGVVTMLMQNGNKEWKPVNRILINPVTRIKDSVLVTKGHDIFFYLSGDQMPFHLYVPARISVNPHQ